MEVFPRQGVKPTSPAHRLILLLTLLASLASAVLAPTLAAAAPVNDDFEQAVELEGFPISVTGTSRGASAEPGEPVGPYDGVGRSVWFKWIAPVTQWVGVQVRLAKDSPGHGIGIFTGEALSELERQRSGNWQNPSRGAYDSSAIDAIAGTTYWIQIDRIQSDDPYVNQDPDPEGGEFWLGISHTCRPRYKSWRAARQRAMAKKGEWRRAVRRHARLREAALPKARLQMLKHKADFWRAKSRSRGITKARRRYLAARQRLRSIRRDLSYWVEYKRGWLTEQLEHARQTRREAKAAAAEVCWRYY